MTTEKKPILIEFNPADSAVDPPSAGILSGGFIDGTDIIYGKNYNHFWRQQYRGLDYIFQPTHTIYISVSGSDTTGIGTIGNPYRNIKKALENVAPNAYTLILLNTAGEYHITEDIELINANVAIVGSTGTEVVFDGKVVVSGGNKSGVCKFILTNSTLKIQAVTITMPDPSSGYDWSPVTPIESICPTAIYCQGSNNRVAISATNINFSSSAVSGDPVLIVPVTESILQLDFYVGTLTTESKGYLIGFTGLTAPQVMLNFQSKLSTIDDPEYLVYNGEDASDEVLTSNTFATFSTNWYFTDGGSENSSVMADDVIDATIETNFYNWYNTMTGLTPTVSVATVRDAYDKINKITITLSDNDGYPTRFPVAINGGGLTARRYFTATKIAEKANFNIISNNRMLFDR